MLIYKLNNVREDCVITCVGKWSLIFENIAGWNSWQQKQVYSTFSFILHSHYLNPLHE